MKKSFLLLSLPFLLLLGACSADTDEAIDNNIPEGKKITITASTGSDSPSTPQTRLGFEDEGTKGVKLTWSKDDSFSLFDQESGINVATFTLKGEAGSSNGDFETTATLDDGKSYAAVYQRVSTSTISAAVPEINGATQTGNGDMKHLDARCYMTAPYIHSDEETNSITFVHEYALLTIKIAPPDDYNKDVHGAPTGITISDSGTSSYALYLSGITNFDNDITAYMFIPPHDATARTLNFQLVCDSKHLFEGKITTSNEHAAGMRYTASLTGERQLTSTNKRSFVVGDYYPTPGDSQTAEGIVFWLKEGSFGTEGKIVSLDQGQGRWGVPSIDEHNDGVEGIRDVENGSQGTKNLIIERKDDTYFARDYYAFHWIYKDKNKEDVNGKWYLPAKEELKALYKGYNLFDKSTFDERLKAAEGGSAFHTDTNDRYWSSSENGSCAYNVIFNNCDTYYDEKDFSFYYVRAVSAFPIPPTGSIEDWTQKEETGVAH